MFKLFLVVNRILDCNEDIMVRLYIATHNILSNKDIQSKLHQLAVNVIDSVHVYSQVAKPNISWTNDSHLLVVCGIRDSSLMASFVLPGEKRNDIVTCQWNH